jgi:hypothetical protein
MPFSLNYLNPLHGELGFACIFPSLTCPRSLHDKDQILFAATRWKIVKEKKGSLSLSLYIYINIYIHVLASNMSSSFFF